MPFLRQLYKQKPSAWGPVSAVQASIFKNAEKFGIAYENILSLGCPGFSNVINMGQILAIGSSYVTNDNYIIPSTTLDGLSIPPPDNIESILTDKFTLFISCSVTGYDPYANLVGIPWYTSAWASPYYSIALTRGATTTSLKFAHTHTSTTYNEVVSDTGILSANGVNRIYACTRNKSNVVFYLNGTQYGTIKTIANGDKTTILKKNNIAIFNRSSGNVGEGAAGSVKIFCMFSTDLSAPQIAYLSDNPYFLLHRVPPVFYSVPGWGIIIKNITDSCIVTDSIAQISNFFSVSDAGAGADGFAGLTAGISVGDAGSGVDTVKPIASLTVQDTGSAIDLIQQISAACSVADTGTGTDSIGQLLASLVVSDAGAGADVITVLKELLKTVTDSGTGTDSISRILASLSVADTGSITDTISQILAGVSVSDAGSGADFINLLKDILKTISDTGTGTDSVSIQPVFVSVQDAGTALDIIGHIAVALSVSDAGTIAEIISTIKTKMVTVTDTGTGSDSAPTISVSLTVSGTASALDLVGQVINSLTVSDTGTGLESITKTDFDILPNGKVTVTFTIKTPGASFAMRTQKTTLNIE